MKRFAGRRGAAGDVSRIMMNLPSVGEVNDQSNGLNWRVLWGSAGYSNTSFSLSTESFNEQSFETGSGILFENNRSLEEIFGLRNINHLRLDTANVAKFGAELKDIVGHYNVFYGSYTDALGNPVDG